MIDNGCELYKREPYSAVSFLMSNKINKQAYQTPEYKLGGYAPEQKLSSRHIPERINTAYTQCYVIGSLVGSFGGFIGYNADNNGFGLLSLIIGGVLILIGGMIHIRATMQSEKVETFLDIKEPSERASDTIHLPLPELSIDLTQILFQLPVVQIAVQITNRGDAIAHNIRAEHWCFLRGQEDFGKRVETPPPVTDFSTAPKIVPGATNCIFLSFPDVKPITWSSVLADTTEIFLLLKIIYTNKNGEKSFRMDKCYRYSNNVHRLMIADRKLWPEGFNFDA